MSEFSPHNTHQAKIYERTKKTNRLFWLFKYMVPGASIIALYRHRSLYQTEWNQLPKDCLNNTAQQNLKL